MPSPWIIRPASIEDSPSISSLLESAETKHRHLDWRTPLDWLEFRPFWVIEQDRHLCSLLAIPPELPHTAWVRLFAANVHPSPLQSWDWLFERCLAQLPSRNQTTLAALGLSPWFCDILENTGFILRQNIIVLNWDNILPTKKSLPSQLTFRPMHRTDLNQVYQIDAISFEPIWQNSLTEVFLSFQAAGVSTVAELHGKIVGYQISTLSRGHLHLTRLAVDPAFQRLSIGYGIVYHLLQYCRQASITAVTVNTQDSNLASQALYLKSNFHNTGDLFPVYIYP